jgi:septum formation protein
MTHDERSRIPDPFPCRDGLQISMTPPWPLILASQSPRRRQLLEEAGYSFTVIQPHDSAETSVDVDGLGAAELVARLAQRKAADVARSVPTGIIVGCDTVAEVGGQILGKPASRQDAWEMLSALRGQLHRVYSGLCLWRRPDDRARTEVDVTTLRMVAISDQQLHEYLDSGLWEGKAGAFGYQDRNDWLTIVAGSESNVVGLPLELLARMLSQMADHRGHST